MSSVHAVTCKTVTEIPCVRQSFSSTRQGIVNCHRLRLLSMNYFDTNFGWMSDYCAARAVEGNTRARTRHKAIICFIFIRFTSINLGLELSMIRKKQKQPIMTVKLDILEFHVATKFFRLNCIICFALTKSIILFLLFFCSSCLAGCLRVDSQS